MGHIFISYSHKDKEYVHKLQETLQQEGFEVWIDDRIDYGTEWPKVIQENLDNCIVFIVVMSKNAYESDMVQNEVTRAREKKKQTFTLLLDGENWLIFQSKQYVDVKNEKLPPDHFYEQLERYIERDEIIDPPMKHITGGWPVYQNDKYHFQLNYPLDIEVTTQDDQTLQIRFPTIKGTNLEEKNCSFLLSKMETLVVFKREEHLSKKEK